jgi:asparagine synthetase B (glutamine-hydrolysing)
MFSGVDSAVIYFIIKLKLKMVDKTSAPAFSIGLSKSGSKPSNGFVPGPGAYETKSMLGNSKVSRTGYAIKNADKAPSNALKDMETIFQDLEAIILQLQ